MKAIRASILLLGVFVLAAAGMVGLARAASYGPAELPFRMTTYEAVVGDEIPTGRCGFAEVFVEGQGTATHLGAVTVYRTHCFNPFQNPPIYDGQWKAIAANGDEIRGSYSGSLVPTEFDEDGNPVKGIINSHFTIEGGTGRFATASGGGTTTAMYDLVADAGNFVSEGTFSR